MFNKSIRNEKGFTLIELLIIVVVIALVAAIIGGGVFRGGFGFGKGEPVSASGVKKATVEVATGSDGLTVEQRNVKERLTRDNKAGSIKHLYIISAMSGQVIIYSTVSGKVTSSGKRLTPLSVVAMEGEMVGDAHEGIPININGQRHYTPEVIQDDGTYGSSIPYIYWIDSKGIYHQHYVSGGQIIHISETPLSVKSITINMEKTK